MAVAAERRGIEALVDAASRTPWRPAAVAAPTFALVAGAGASQGSYFPTSWGWIALALSWVAALAVIMRTRGRLTRLELATVAALTCLTAWIGTSVVWSEDVPQSVLEVERAVVYVAALLAALVVLTRPSLPAFLAGVLVGITTVCGYGLSTRLFSERFDLEYEIAGARLAYPMGYWNALGLFAAMGILLAIGFAASARGVVSRSLAAASLVVLAPTLYFTFSRGAWLVVFGGLAVAVMLEQRRLRLLALLVVIAPAPVLAVALASRSDALTEQGLAFTRASGEGHRLAVAIASLAAIAAAAAAVFEALERRVVPTELVRRLFAGALAAAAVGAVVTVFVQYGAPPTLVRKGWDALDTSASVRPGESLNKRLFSLASTARTEHWEVAWDQFRDHPALGSGAGTFEQRWLRERDGGTHARDAHSLYLETLAELGPVGLALLLVALGAPLAAAVRARRRLLVPTLAGAYAAYIAHAGIDWDWEVVAVTMTALLCGAALLVAARPDRVQLPLAGRFRVPAVALTLVITTVSLIGLVGNRALAASEDALEDGRWREATREAKTATRWARWSGDAWRNLGLAQLELGGEKAARASLLKAIDRDPSDWSVWYDLGVVTTGAESDRAYAEAERLNPLSQNVAVLRIVTDNLPALERDAP